MSGGIRLRVTGGSGPNVVALGGGHGLAATLRALRRITDTITAVVGVADDGGSSGRLRGEFGVLPPGDLRMALAALCGDDTWGRTWARVVQHRFGGEGQLSGHSVGNLLITALWEETGNAVTGLDWLGALLGSQGRVLPCSTVPLEIVAEVVGIGASPDTVTEVRGQVAAASTPGEVRSIRLVPTDPPACPEALDAISAADVLILGPGSWFTSVMPHLAIPEQRRAIEESSAKKVVILNLNPQHDQEMSGRSIAGHLDVLMRTAPGLGIDVVIADPAHVDDIARLAARCAHLGARLDLASVEYPDGINPGQHDPARLAVALAGVTSEWQDGTPWR